MSPDAPPTWGFFHLNSSRFNGLGLTDTKAMRGQHRAWTDGSVEYVPGPSINTDLTLKDIEASYKTGPAGGYFAYYWF